LIDESYVNAVLVLVVVTCVAGPILAERYARRMKGEIEDGPVAVGPQGAGHPTT
jgi:hypothetical protein